MWELSPACEMPNQGSRVAFSYILIYELEAFRLFYLIMIYSGKEWAIMSRNKAKFRTLVNIKMIGGREYNDFEEECSAKEGNYMGDGETLSSNHYFKMY